MAVGAISRRRNMKSERILQAEKNAGITLERAQELIDGAMLPDEREDLRRMTLLVVGWRIEERMKSLDAERLTRLKTTVPRLVSRIVEMLGIMQMCKSAEAIDEMAADFTRLWEILGLGIGFEP